MQPWYDNLDRMAEDDAHLARLVRAARAELCPQARRRVRHVHIYPSLGCTYTLDKRRIFVAVRDPETGRRLPDCAIRHVLRHEMAHAASPSSSGHDHRFRHTLRRLDVCAGEADAPPACPDALPPTYNAACRNAAAVAGLSRPRPAAAAP